MKCINCLDSGVITTTVADPAYPDGGYTTNEPCDNCNSRQKTAAKQDAHAKRSREMSGEEYADMMMKKLGIG